MREIPVEVHEEAIAEAQAAREWYESRSPVAAIRFFTMTSRWSRWHIIEGSRGIGGVVSSPDASVMSAN
jgi:hypothetical protein